MILDFAAEEVTVESELCSVLIERYLPEKTPGSENYQYLIPSLALSLNKGTTSVLFSYDVPNLLKTRGIPAFFLGALRKELRIPRDRSLALSSLIAKTIKVPQKYGPCSLT